MDLDEGPRWRRRVNDDDGAPAIDVGSKPAHELQRDMGNVWVQTIGRICIGSEVIDENSGGGGDEEYRRSSKRQSKALEMPRSGRRAPRW
jgi:hypothetical protein